MGVVHAKQTEEYAVKEHFFKLSEVQTRVDKIHIDGLDRTKDDIILAAVEDLFHVRNFEQLVMKAQEARKQLALLGAFKSIDVTIDTSEGADSTPDGVEVTFDVLERNKLLATVNTLFGNNEGSLSLGLSFPNILGRGECFRTEYHYGTKCSSGFSANATKPFLGRANPRINGMVFESSSDYPWSGFQEARRGLVSEILFNSAPHTRHKISWEGVWRELKCLSPTTPFAVREESGHTVKASVKHIMTTDNRDDSILPTFGTFFQLYQEYAGLGGNVNFLKHELQYQINRTLFTDLVLQGSLMAGLVRNVSEDKLVRINDRFYLGGPLSVRGFALYGVGPHAEEHSLGAEVYWAGAMHLYAPLPFKPWKAVLDKICRTHLFINAGNIGNFPFTDDYHQNIMMLLNNLRWSFGAGIVLSVGAVARFELNYCIPMSFQSGDRINKGLQFGIGMTFL